MDNKDRFIWHPSAKLFAGAQNIAPPSQTFANFQNIIARPSETALMHLASTIKGGAGFCLSERPVSPPNTACFVTLTGGTSGAPKLILRKPRSWIESFFVNAALFQYQPDDAVAVLGALSHSLSLYGVMEALHLGLAAHVLDDLSPHRQVDHIATHAISILYLTPSQLRLLARSKRPHQLPGVRLILCGGGALNKDTRARAQTMFPNAAIRVFYGAAETSFITLADEQTPEGSVGRAFPCVEIRVLDHAGQPTKGIGEVWVKSPYLFEGYVQDIGTEARWVDGFVSVGEFGQFDAQGYLWLEGRKSRMVNIADQNVFLEAIEAHITGMVQIDTCAVVARPDMLRGHHLIAVVEGEPDKALSALVRQTCRDAFGPLATPRTVLFCPSMPLLSSGKIDMMAVTAWAQEQI